MKIRKAIAATIIATTALMGTATTADAFNPQPDPPASAPAVDQHTVNPTGQRTIDTTTTRGGEIDFVEVAGSDSKSSAGDAFEAQTETMQYGGAREVYMKFELVKVS